MIINISNNAVTLTIETGEILTVENTEELEAIVTQLTDYVTKNRPKTTTEKTVEFISENASDEQLIELSDIFEAWQVGAHYKEGKVVRFNGELYKITQTHTSQSDWLPPSVPAIYVRVAPPGVVEEWRQPAGAHDAYKIGDKVIYNGKTYESSIDGNIWSPEAYPQGWREV